MFRIEIPDPRMWQCIRIQSLMTLEGQYVTTVNLSIELSVLKPAIIFIGKFDT